jgi:release factor glutamine methyltransferase
MGSPFEAIAAARAALTSAGISHAEATIDAEVLARHVLGWDRAHLAAYGRDPAPADFERKFQQLVVRRRMREPVAMIVGHREFWGLEFEVSKAVLIPRPETEIVIDEALAFARTAPCRLAIDVGTGSGCIAVALAHELADVRVIAVDISADAIEVARRNAIGHQVADRVEFREGNLLDSVSETADLILSNPPYVQDADAAALQPEVIQFEPHAALFGGADGLDVVRRLLNGASTRLAPQGRLIVEFGFGQEHAIRQLAEAAGWTIVRIREDLQGIPRTAVLSRANVPPAH